MGSVQGVISLEIEKKENNIRGEKEEADQTEKGVEDNQKIASLLVDLVQ